MLSDCRWHRFPPEGQARARRDFFRSRERGVVGPYWPRRPATTRPRMNQGWYMWSTAGTIGMSAKMDFYFDFISPFGYLASLRVDELAQKYGHECRWHSMLLGISVLKVMGLPPLTQIPLKGDYLGIDLKRYLRRHQLSLARSR